MHRNPVTHRFTRIPFGIISIPFLLDATMKHHLTCKINQPVHHLNEDSYVQNLITGADNIKETLQLYSKANKLSLDISVNLQHCNSKPPELNKKIAGQDCMKETMAKVLGPVDD